MVKEKRCPKCSRVYFDETLNYCLADGSFLYFPEELADQPTGAETEWLNVPPETEEVFVRPTDAPTEVLEIPTEVRNIAATERSFSPAFDNAPPPARTNSSRVYVLIAVIVTGWLAIMGGIYLVKNWPGTDPILTNISRVNGISSTPTSTPSRTSTPAPDASLVGTRWSGKGSGGSKYAIKFLSGGDLEYSTGEGAPDKDLTNNWKTENGKIIVNINNYSHWEGVRVGDQINFRCINNTKNEWTTTATLVK